MDDQRSQPATEPVAPVPVTPVNEERERAVQALAANIERLDELGLRDELGRALVEPASTFRWS
jgi:hypothetical protein